MRIRVVAPLTSDPGKARERADWLGTVPRRDTTTVSFASAALRGSLPLDGMGRVAAEADALLRGIDTQLDGHDAVVVDGPFDQAVDALRSRLQIPVVGSLRAALVYASLLGGRRIAVAASAEDARLALERSITTASAWPWICDLAVVDPLGGPAALRAWAARAVENHRAGSLLLGSPELEVQAEDVQTTIPIIRPGMIGVKVAEAIADLGLSHSRIAYLPPAVSRDAMLDRRLRHRSIVEVEVPSGPTPASYRLKVVVPISGMTDGDLALRADALSPGLLRDTTRVDYRSLSDSSNSADCQYDSMLLDLFCAEEELRADAEGYDAVLVDSTTDSGIPGVRSHLRALSLGPGEACWALASVLGEHFTILSMERKWEHFFLKNLELLGRRDRLASIEDIGIAPDPVRLFEGKEGLMNQRLIEAGWRGVNDHRADVIVIGSTTMHQALAALAAALPVPVLSPGRVGVRTAEMLLDLGLRHVGTGRYADHSIADMVFDPQTRTEPRLVHA
jgi:allantoin racemase